MTTYDSDRPMTVLGVSGRLTHRTTYHDRKPDCWFKQCWISEARPIDGYDNGAKIRAEMRFDDECKNGHNTFAITGDIFRLVKTKSGTRKEEIAGGCLHEDIAKAFPELAPLIKWHLTSTDGPMHYLGNTVYMASNRDYNGKLASEPRAWEIVIQFGRNPIKHRFAAYKENFIRFLQDHRALVGDKPYDFEVLPIYHDDKPGTSYKFGPKYTFGGYADKWHECPFDTEDGALDFLLALQTCEPQFVQIVTAWGEGKARELDAARRMAVWPDATDAELMADPDALKATLQARLPTLLAAFRADMERIGFVWSPVDYKVDEAVS